MVNLSRRRFLKIGAGTIAASGALDGSIRVIAGSDKPAERGVRSVPTFCNLCFWECGAIATVRPTVEVVANFEIVEEAGTTGV